MQAQRRAMNNLLFIGHLYCSKLLTEKIMHDCIKKLLAEVVNPKQEDIKCLCKVMFIVGAQLNANPKAKFYMDVYFDRIMMLMRNQRLDHRTRAMLQVGFGSSVLPSPVRPCIESLS